MLKMTHSISRWPDTQEWLRLWCICSTGQLCTLTEQNFTDHALSVKLRGFKAWVRFSRARTEIPWARPAWFCGMRNYHMT